MLLQVINTTTPPHPPRSSDKGQKLQEAWEQQQFLRAVEDIEDWIGDMESQMASEDLGRDLISVNNLIKKHAVCQSICHMSVCLFVSLFVCLSDHILQFHEDTHIFLLPIIHITTTILTPHTPSPAHHICTTHILLSIHITSPTGILLPTHPLLHLLCVHHPSTAAGE